MQSCRLNFKSSLICSVPTNSNLINNLICKSSPTIHRWQFLSLVFVGVHQHLQVNDSSSKESPLFTVLCSWHTKIHNHMMPKSNAINFYVLTNVWLSPFVYINFHLCHQKFTITWCQSKLLAQPTSQSVPG